MGNKKIQVRTLLKLDFFKSGLKNFFKIKNKGMAILVPTIILSGLILVVSVGLSQVLMTELEFSADLLFSEKAYFAAESGVEKSLLALKEKPLNWVVETEKQVGSGATYDLNIANSVSSFPFSLAKNETIKFRLGVDRDKEFAGYSITAVRDFNINIITGNEADLQWKILCQNLAKKTIALYGSGDDFSKGDYDNGESIVKNKQRSAFLNGVSGVCFMSLSFPEKLAGIKKSRAHSSQNSQNTEMISGTVYASSSSKGKRIAPARVSIRAAGKSFSREKIVTFQYLQKNLSSIFDLGLYFTRTANP